MKKQLTLLLLLLSFTLNAQIFRSIKIVEPRQVVRSTLDNSKYACLVKRDYLFGGDKYYYVSSDANGNLLNQVYRYGNQSEIQANVEIPPNFVAYTVNPIMPNCNPNNGTFAVLSTSATSGSNVQFVFDAANLTEMSVNINGANAPPYNVASIFPTSNTITVYPSPALPAGTYTLTINGVSCTGSASRNFNVLGDGGGDPNLPTALACVTSSNLSPAPPNILASAGTPSGNFDSIGGWIFDQNNTQVPQTVDLYISGQYVASTKAFRNRDDVNNAYNLPAQTRTAFEFQLKGIKWWQDGTPRDLSMRIGGTSTLIGIFPSNATSTQIQFSGGGSGSCSPPYTSIDLPTYTNGVNIQRFVNPVTAGFSHSPDTDSFDYLTTSEMRVGLCNNYGGGPDFIARINETNSRSNQIDAGVQFGVDTYIGGPYHYAKNGQQTNVFLDPDGLYRWVTTPNFDQFPVGYNVIPQGTYNLIVQSPNNFGGMPEDSYLLENGKVHYSRAKLYQYGFGQFVNGSVQKIYGFAKQEQWARYVTANAIHFKVKIIFDANMPNYHSPEFDNLMNDITSSAFIFYDRGNFPIVKTYEGSTPYTNGGLTNFDIRSITQDRVQQTFDSSESWIGGFNTADTDGIGFVWKDDYQYGSSVESGQGDTSSPRGSGFGTFYNTRKWHRKKGESIIIEYYLVLGNSTQVRQFAYDLRKRSGTPTTYENYID